MSKSSNYWIRWAFGVALLWLFVSAVYLRVFAPIESIGFLPTSVLIETAANALNAGSQQTGCRRTQYADAPEVLSQSEFRFQPMPEFQNKCPYVIIGVDPYWGDVASRVEEKI